MAKTQAANMRPGVWFRLPNGRRARIHTEMSATITNILRPYLISHPRFGTAEKLAFEIEDKLKRKLRSKKGHAWT